MGRNAGHAVTPAVCLDCGCPTITAACPSCTEERQRLDGEGWFAQLRADLWEQRPAGDWDGAGLRREHVRPAPTTTRQRKPEAGGERLEVVER